MNEIIEQTTLSPSLKNFHDKVYVLTIASATDRHESTIHTLGEGNFEFVYGVDKQTVTREQLIENGTYDEEGARKFDPENRVMTLGHVCCSMGHKMVYEKFLESGAERALICEDDVVDVGIPEAEFAAAVAAVPDDADIVYWGWWGGRLLRPLGELQLWIYHINRVFGRYRFNHKQIRNLYMRTKNKYFYTSASNYLLHAYTLSRKGAETLLEYNTPIIMNADHAPIHAILDGRIKGYAARKQYLYQRSIDPKDPMESFTDKYY